MIRGRLEPFFETGTEGVCWSVSDPSEPGYYGLWPLCDGDHLRVLGPDDEILWDGQINLEYLRERQSYPHNPEHGQQAVLGMWVRGLQADVDPEVWARMFFEKYRATLQLGPQQSPRIQFSGPLATLADRLRTIPKPEEMFRAALYPWLHFSSESPEHSSLAREWNFNLDETIRLIGSPTEAQIAAWKHYPQLWGTMLMPFDWTLFERLALLFRLYGRLNWLFHRPEHAATWISADRKALLLDGIEGIRQVCVEAEESDV